MHDVVKTAGFRNEWVKLIVINVMQNSMRQTDNITIRRNIVTLGC